MRALPVSTSDIYNRSSLDKKQRSLQDGTPKWIEAGQARACYASISTTGGLGFYDRYFQPVRTAWSPGNSAHVNTGNIINIPNGADLETLTGLFKGASTTVTQITTQTTADHAGACHSSGEFGNVVTDSFSNSTAVAPHARSSEGRLGKAKLNMSVINSDHTDQSIVYVHHGYEIRAMSRIFGDIRYDSPGTSKFTVDYSGYGQASYNAKRKELVIVAYYDSGARGGKKIVSYSNVDFNRYPSPAEALSRPEVVKKTVTVNTISSWHTTDTDESKFNTKCILCDDGSIFVLAHFTSTGLYQYKITRKQNLDVDVITSSFKSVGGTTYGLATGMYYGMRLIQSRDKKACIVFMPYVNYGAGSIAYVIDKQNAIALPAAFANKSNTVNGVNIMPYGDDGFACYVSSDVTASISTTAMVTLMYRLNGSNWADITAGTVLPYYPLPKTIYYPALTQVVDYSLLINQTLI